MEVIWTTPARLQLAEAIEYIAEKDPLAALILDEKVDKTIERLSQFPNSSRIGRLQGTREAVVDSYILVYEVHHAHLLITDFVHGAQMFPKGKR